MLWNVPVRLASRAKLVPFLTDSFATHFPAPSMPFSATLIGAWIMRLVVGKSFGLRRLDLYAAMGIPSGYGRKNAR